MKKMFFVCMGLSLIVIVLLSGMQETPATSATKAPGFDPAISGMGK